MFRSHPIRTFAGAFYVDQGPRLGFACSFFTREVQMDVLLQRYGLLVHDGCLPDALDPLQKQAGAMYQHASAIKCQP